MTPCRNNQLIRALHVLQALQRGPRTLYRLADEMQVTTRTIRRDLDALSCAGYAVTNDKFDSGEVHFRLISTACPVCERSAAA